MSLPSLTARLRTAVLGHVFLEERLYFVIPRQHAGLEPMDHPAASAPRTDRLGRDAEYAAECQTVRAERAPAAERPDLIAHPEPVAASHDAPFEMKGRANEIGDIARTYSSSSGKKSGFGMSSQVVSSVRIIHAQHVLCEASPSSP